MMQRALLHTLVLSALLALPSAAQSTDRAALVARIDSIIEAALAADGTPGITLAVVHGSDTLALKGYGLADVENGVTVSDRSVFRVGSVTKQFTAAAVMKEVEAGRIRLEAPISEYLPDYPMPGAQVTIHQLLNHTSGIPSYTGIERFWTQSRLDLAHEQMLELFATDSLQFEPGTRSAYNNSGYYLLGMILERVTGRSYAEHVASALAQPLGLTQTLYCGQREIIPHRAQGYEVADGHVYNAAPLSMGPPGAAGALCSTPRELVRWTRALAAGEIVSADSYARMTAPTPLAGGISSPLGYGLVAQRLGDYDVIEHGGGINGFVSMLSHYPEPGLTIAVVANGPTSVEQLERRIARMLLGVPEPVVQDLPLTPAERARYVGTYDLRPAVPLEVRVFEQGDRLMAQGTGQPAFPLRYQGDHTFDGPEASSIRMVFTVEGERATMFTLSQGGGALPARRVD
jgi:D-alanyl-D-alanine carboxypeptidase